MGKFLQILPASPSCLSRTSNEKGHLHLITVWHRSCLSSYTYYGMKNAFLLMNCEEFEWDKHNVTKNWLKHHVSPAECEELFFNSPLILFEDEKLTARIGQAEAAWPRSCFGSLAPCFCDKGHKKSERNVVWFLGPGGEPWVTTRSSHVAFDGRCPARTCPKRRCLVVLPLCSPARCAVV